MANDGPFNSGPTGGGPAAGRIFEDLARVAGGALGAAGGLKADAEALMRTQAAKLIEEFDLVRREDFEAARAMAANARAGQEKAEAALADLEARVTALEVKMSSAKGSE
ncbi:MAG: accessory factor UbiK family protein [Alphaproteobacteria bacterium]|jgi:BMFP domain-containing protein YqiC|nr:accessory factor UbiK family protein [Alphaproteobacteria bacterium]